MIVLKMMNEDNGNFKGNDDNNVKIQIVMRAMKRNEQSFRKAGGFIPR